MIILSKAHSKHSGIFFLLHFKIILSQVENIINFEVHFTNSKNVVVKLAFCNINATQFHLAISVLMFVCLIVFFFRCLVLSVVGDSKVKVLIFLALVCTILKFIIRVCVDLFYKTPKHT